MMDDNVVTSGCDKDAISGSGAGVLFWLVFIIAAVTGIAWLFSQPSDYRDSIMHNLNNTALGLLVFMSAQPGILGGGAILAAGLKREHGEQRPFLVNLGLGVMFIGGLVPPILLSLVSPSIVAWLNG